MSPTSPRLPLKFHRVGLFQSWRGNMDEGWTRYVFDDLGIPYKTLHNEDIKGTKEKKPDLRADYDVIVFADENANTDQDGSALRPSDRPRADARARAAGWASAAQPRLPPEYEGGIGQEGVDNLKAFVEKGGIIVTLNGACDFAIARLRRSRPKRPHRASTGRKFFCPTSIVRILVDNETPIGYGMPKEAGAMFVNSLALETIHAGLRLGPEGRRGLSGRQGPA